MHRSVGDRDGRAHNAMKALIALIIIVMLSEAKHLSELSIALRCDSSLRSE